MILTHLKKALVDLTSCTKCTGKKTIQAEIVYLPISMNTTDEILKQDFEHVCNLIREHLHVRVQVNLSKRSGYQVREIIQMFVDKGISARKYSVESVN